MFLPGSHVLKSLGVLGTLADVACGGSKGWGGGTDFGPLDLASRRRRRVLSLSLHLFALSRQSFLLFLSMPFFGESSGVPPRTRYGSWSP